MRILHILDHSIPLHSGYTFRTLSLLKGQRALGWETFHLTGPKQGEVKTAEETIDGWHFFRTIPAPTFFSTLPWVSYIELMGEITHRLEQVCKRIKPHVLHAHSPVLNAIPALRVGRRLGIPVVYEVRAFWEDAAVDHGTTKEGSLRYRFSQWLETYALKRADSITTICEGLRQDIIRRGIPADRITVIPNAVDVENFQRGGQPDEALKKSFGLEGKTVIGFIGSFYAYEGLDLLVGALPLILKRTPHVRVLLVGGGPQERVLKLQAEELGMADKIVFAGRVSHSEVSRYYNLIDLLAYPRHPMRLTELVTPLKPLEAMAQGKVLIASDVGGHRELIRDGETGLLFKSGDPIAFTNKVVEAVQHPERWESIRVAGRRFVEAERTWGASVARYQSVYDRLISGTERSDAAVEKQTRS
jgi:PEP-CTERM/exosortase A-associated glycosyltransferase